MCGRFALTLPPDAVRAYFSYQEHPNFPPRYNIAPTQPIGVVRNRDGEQHFDLLRWGFVPGWAKDLTKLPLMINARAETVQEKPAFRHAIRRRRCLVPADAFYEWQAIEGGGKRAFMIRRSDCGVFAFAGIWEYWMDAGGNELESAAILTTGANKTLKPIHHRMPVIVMPDRFDVWLENDETDMDEAAALMGPPPDDFFETIEVSDRVNKVKNDDASVQQPAGCEPAGIVETDVRRSTDQLDLF